MNPHDEKERLLEQLLAGEIAITDGEVQRAMREDPSFAKEVDELLALRDELSVEAPVDLDAAEPWAGADQQIADRVAAELGGAGAPETKAARVWPLWAAAAAALAISLLVWKPWHTQPVVDPDQKLTLDEGQVWPKGEVLWDEFVRRGFQWNIDAPDDAKVWIEIEVNDEPLRPKIDVTGKTQLPVPAELLATPPDSLFWDVYFKTSARGSSHPAQVTFR